MDQKQLWQMREEIEDAIADRQAAGEYNADSKHMLLLLKRLLALTDHAISQLPKRVK